MLIRSNPSPASYQNLSSSQQHRSAYTKRRLPAKGLLRIPLRLLHRFERAAAFDIPTKQGSDTGRVVGGLFPLLEDEVRRAQSLVWGVRIVAGKAEFADENAAVVAEIRAIGDGVPAPNFGFRARGICMRRLRVSTWSPD